MRAGIRGAPLAELLVSIALISFPVAHVQAADKTLVNNGELLVRNNCSRCHTIGKEGDSPHPQ